MGQNTLAVEHTLFLNQQWLDSCLMEFSVWLGYAWRAHERQVQSFTPSCPSLFTVEFPPNDFPDRSNRLGCR